MSSISNKEHTPVKDNLMLNLGCYSATHCIVDTTTIATVTSTGFIHSLDIEYYLFLIILYNFLAFATQFVFGYIFDYYKVPRTGAIAGCLLAGTGTITLYFNPLIAVIIAGLANSMFHAGGGAISLNITPGRATAPGIFVAPGAMGVFLGIYIGKNSLFAAWPLLLILGIAVLSMLYLNPPAINYEKKNLKIPPGLFEGLILLFLVTVLIRALVGLCIPLPWKADLTLLIILTLIVVSGKAIGGVIADKLGWKKVAITALILSAPLLAFGHNIPSVALGGAFLFQFTMAVTLTSIALLLPGKPGFAFGLPCLALFLGAIPSFTSYKTFLGNDFIILGIILFSAITLFAGLKTFDKYAIKY